MFKEQGAICLPTMKNFRFISFALSVFSSFIFWTLVRDFSVNILLPRWLLAFNEAQVSYSHFLYSDGITALITILFGVLIYRLVRYSLLQYSNLSFEGKYKTEYRVSFTLGFTGMTGLIYLFGSSFIFSQIIFIIMILAPTFWFGRYYLGGRAIQHKDTPADREYSKKGIWTWRFLLFVIGYAFVLIRFSDILPDAFHLLDFYSKK